jgi:hypothetical protein
MSSVFRTKNLQDTGIDNVFLLEKSCRKKMYTIFSAVQRQQEKWRHDVFWSHRLQRCLLSGSSLHVSHYWSFGLQRCCGLEYFRIVFFNRIFFKWNEYFSYFWCRKPTVSKFFKTASVLVCVCVYQRSTLTRTSGGHTLTHDINTSALTTRWCGGSVRCHTNPHTFMRRSRGGGDRKFKPWFLGVVQHLFCVPKAAENVIFSCYTTSYA